jgi:hypothetical protein
MPELKQKLNEFDAARRAAIAAANRLSAGMSGHIVSVR